MAVTKKELIDWFRKERERGYNKFMNELGNDIMTNPKIIWKQMSQETTNQPSPVQWAAPNKGERK